MRLFFALWPPGPVADRLGALASDCALRYGGRATRPDTLHLTQVFLGEVADDRLQRLIDAARRVDARSFTFHIDRLGYWQHNHLLWAGSRSPPAALIELVTRLRCALAEEGFAEADPAREFAAHITLVRRIPELKEPALPALSRPLDWPVGQFALVESCRSQAGPIYRRIAVFGLPA